MDSDLGGPKHVGYDHDKQEGGATAAGAGNIAGVQRQEEEQQHQVQPPNLKVSG